MEKVFIVLVRGWSEDEWIIWSVHRTEAGAEAVLDAANQKYDTKSAWIDDRWVRE